MQTEETQKVISDYTAKGWEFFTSSTQRPIGGLLVWTHYRSLRMLSNGSVVENFTEEDLLREESRFYAQQQHGAQIAIALNSVTHDLIRQLGLIYFQQTKDKVVDIPSEIIVNNVVIQLKPGTKTPATDEYSET